MMRLVPLWMYRLAVVHYLSLISTTFTVFVLISTLLDLISSWTKHTFECSNCKSYSVPYYNLCPQFLSNDGRVHIFSTMFSCFWAGVFRIFYLMGYGLANLQFNSFYVFISFCKFYDCRNSKMEPIFSLFPETVILKNIISSSFQDING